jgi:hypothetical protein
MANKKTIAEKKGELAFLLEAADALYGPCWSKKDIEAISQWLQKIADKKGDSDA